MRVIEAGDAILIRCLAYRDAVFAPQRRFFGCNETARHIGANTVEARRDFLASGVRWASGGTSGTQRWQAMRTLEQLVADGLVEVRKAGGRTSHLSLTLAGEVRASRLTMSESILDPLGWTIFQAVGDLAYGWKDGLVSEEALLPVWETFLGKELAPEVIADWTRQERLVDIQNSLAPFLCREWLASICTVHGNCRYGRVPASLSAPVPEFDGPVPSFDDETKDAGRDMYIDLWNQRYGELATETPKDPSEIGQIPCSVGRDPNGWDPATQAPPVPA